MKAILPYILTLIPIVAAASEPAMHAGSSNVNSYDVIMKEFSQNEEGFETDPEKSMEANNMLFNKLVEASLANDIANINVEHSSTDEIARVGLLNYAYADDLETSFNLVLKAAEQGNVACINLLGVWHFYSDEVATAYSLITAADGLRGSYLPVLYNKVLLMTILNPKPDKKIRQEIIDEGNQFYRFLAAECDPEKDYSIPPYTMAEFISVPRAKDTYKNRKYYMRGHSLLHHIRKVVPDYNPPVKFKEEY